MLDVWPADTDTGSHAMTLSEPRETAPPHSQQFHLGKVLSDPLRPETAPCVGVQVLDFCCCSPWFACLLVCLVLFCFQDEVSLYSPGCPRTHFVDHAALELPESLCLPLPPKGWNYRNVPLGVGFLWSWSSVLVSCPV